MSAPDSVSIATFICCSTSHVAVAEAKKLHAAQVRRQRKLLRELGVADLSPEEVTERARATQGRHEREALAERHP